MSIRPEFDHVALNEEGLAKATHLRQSFSALLEEVEYSCLGATGGREAALARTKLQEAAFWALKALSLNAVNQAAKLLALLFVGAVALGASPAAAQELIVQAVDRPAPSWLQLAIEALFAVVVALVVRPAMGALKAVSAGTSFSTAVATVEQLITARVAKLQAQFSEAAADGKITDEELKAILASVKAELPMEVLGAVKAQLGGGMEAWLQGLVIDAVTKRQQVQAEARGAAAEARISDLNAALKERAARAVGTTP